MDGGVSLELTDDVELEIGLGYEFLEEPHGGLDRTRIFSEPLFSTWELQGMERELRVDHLGDMTEATGDKQQRNAKNRCATQPREKGLRLGTLA